MQDHGDIKIAHRKTRRVHSADCFIHKDARVRSLPLGIVIREELANIILPQGTEDGINDGVINDIAIRVRHAAAIVFDVHTTDDELVAWFETMQVEAVADAEWE